MTITRSLLSRLLLCRSAFCVAVLLGAGCGETAPEPDALNRRRQSPRDVGPMVAPDYSKKVALIVVGSNIYDSEQMHVNFGHSGDRVFDGLKADGFEDDNIFYLSWDTSNPNVDARASLENIELYLKTELYGALDNGANNELVMIYFIGHGVDINTGTQGRYWFMSNTITPQSNGNAGTVLGVYLRSLDRWIDIALTDTLGVGTSKNFKDATLVFDTCFSGRIFEGDYALTGPSRTVIAAAAANDPVVNGANLAFSWWTPPQTWFDNRPSDSNGETMFTYFFMAQFAGQATVRDAFTQAVSAVSSEVRELAQLAGASGTEEQHPMISP